MGDNNDDSHEEHIRMQEVKSQTESVFIVHEIKKHYQDHEPVFRAQQPWIQEQRKLLEVHFSFNTRVTTTELLETLKEANMVRGCTKRILSKWLKVQRRNTAVSLSPSDYNKIDSIILDILKQSPNISDIDISQAEDLKRCFIMQTPVNHI